MIRNRCEMCMQGRFIHSSAIIVRADHQSGMSTDIGTIPRQFDGLFGGFTTGAGDDLHGIRRHRDNFCDELSLFFPGQVNILPVRSHRHQSF